MASYSGFSWIFPLKMVIFHSYVNVYQWVNVVFIFGVPKKQQDVWIPVLSCGDSPTESPPHPPRGGGGARIDRWNELSRSHCHS